MATPLQQHFQRIDLAALAGRAAAATTVLLILLVAWFGARLTWLLLTPRAELPQQAAVARTATPRAVRNRQDSDIAERVVAAHLFGVATTKKVEAVEAPETRLNLKLRGVYATDDESKGYALIASGSGREKLYATGQSVPGNAVLKAVFPDRVILDRKGRYETLRMVNTKASGGSTYVPRSSGGNTTVRKLGQDSRVVKLREEILRNPRKLAELVSAQPAYENGVFAGYRITTRRSDPVFEELNLRSGDIITEVNGIQIDSPQKGLQILQQLARASQASVTIKRGGQYIQLDLSL